jgi:hypothetical protein
MKAVGTHLGHAAAGLAILAVGILLGVKMAKPDPAATGSDGHSSAGHANRTISGAYQSERRKSRPPIAGKEGLPVDPGREEIMRDIRDAMLLPAESRSTPLLKALERTTALDLSPELLGLMRGIIDEGDLDSSHFILSLMEQREEKSSVDLILHALDNPNPDIADRALFALEAVAGNVFKSRDEATAWAANWQPDQSREKLFSPDNSRQDETQSPQPDRVPGPASYEPRDGR